MADITHEQLDQALAAASKERLIFALRAVVTAAAWAVASEDDIREGLREIAHSPGSSHEAVYNAVVNGA